MLSQLRNVAFSGGKKQCTHPTSGMKITVTMGIYYRPSVQKKFKCLNFPRRNKTETKEVTRYEESAY